MTSGNGGHNLAVPVALLSVVALAIAILSLVFSLLAFTGGPTGERSAAPADPAAYTQAFVQKALDYYDSHGRTETIEYYNATTHVDGQWYVFIIDENEIMIAHPLRKDRIGTGRADRVDSTGHAYGPEMAAATAAGQWVNYHFVNPQTGLDTLKRTWIVRHDGLYFGSGWWE